MALAIVYIKAESRSNSIWIITPFIPDVKLFLPRRNPAKRFRAEAMNDDIVGISRLRDMELNIIDEELVTHTGFEPMLTA